MGDQNRIRRRNKIVLVFADRSESAIKGVLESMVPAAAMTQIQLCSIPNHWRNIRPVVTRAISSKCPSDSPLVHILVFDSLQWDGNLGQSEGDFRKISRISSLQQFRNDLPRILFGVELDWNSIVQRNLGLWRHERIDSFRVDAWLDQFDRLGSSRWIGETLLQVFDFWSDQRLVDSVQLTLESLSAYSYICFNREKAGKSGDVLANLFRKKLSSIGGQNVAIEDLREVLARRDESLQGGGILFMEDALFSGTEIIKTFEDLLDMPLKEGRQRRVSPLPDKRLVKDREILIFFPVATTLGVERVRRFLKSNDLSNVRIEYSISGELKVLTPEGCDALGSGDFFDASGKIPRSPDLHIRQIPFDDNKGKWKSEDRILRAKQFCREVGCQLWGNYIERMGWKWSEDRIRSCGMGMMGVGLAVAFTHSIPKASLPIFWGSGPVELNRKRIDWNPLFCE